MATRHTISRAAELFSQGAYYPRFNPVPGLPVGILNHVIAGVIPGGAPNPAATGVLAAAVANGYCASQSSTGSNNALAINGSLASNGVGTPDAAKNVVAAWTATAVMTVAGTDMYGAPQTEASASGTSFTGKKAFGSILAVTFSAAVTAATVGTGVKFGLPYLIGNNGLQGVQMDNAPDTGYTLVIGDQTSPATTTTGDVRGTLTFTTAPNGTHFYSYLMKVYDRTGGTDKRSGAFGVIPV